MVLFKMKRPTLFFTGLLVLMLATSLPVFLGLPLPMTILLLILYVVILFVFSFTHGIQTLGIRAISVLLGITVVVTYLMEWLGTHFGVPFGHYYYTNQLGPLLMEVPFVIPIQWFNMLYVCYIMVNIIVAGGNRVEDKEDSMKAAESRLPYVLPRVVVTSILVGLFMVSWDFINDPYMVGVGSWVWTEPTEFFGLAFQDIPLSNFIGWVFTSVVTILLFDLYRHLYRVPLMWVQENASETANILIIVPYLHALFFQAVNGVLAGVFSVESVAGWAPIALAAVCMGLATTATVARYQRLRS